MKLAAHTFTHTDPRRNSRVWQKAYFGSSRELSQSAREEYADEVYALSMEAYLPLHPPAFHLR